MPSSRSTTTGAPFRCGTSTGTTSSARAPDSQPACARRCDRADHASCSSRLIPSSAFTSSEDSPMTFPVNVDHRPSWIIVSIISVFPSREPSRALGST